jgi:DNA-binding response OmpR family regulator
MTSPLYGADAFIDKPFEFEDLDTKIDELIKKKR